MKFQEFSELISGYLIFKSGSTVVYSVMRILGFVISLGKSILKIV